MRIITKMLILTIIAGCASGEKELMKTNGKKMARPQDFGTVEYELEENRLSPEAIRSFESKVPQLFKELVEYVKIGSDENNNEDFRKEAYTTIKGYLLLNNNQDTAISNRPVFNFIQDHANWSATEIVNIQLDSGLKISDAGYASTVSYQLKDGSPETIGVYLIKRPKKFGNEVHNVWKIAFGL